MSNLSDIQRRVRGLLKLSKSDNEHEAAAAASRAAKLIAEYQLNEALLRVDDDTRKPEAILTEAQIEGEQYHVRRDKRHKRVAWKGTIAAGVADSLGAEMWWDGNNGIRCFGRETATQAWSYMCRYLYNEVDRLCEEAWSREGAAAARAGQSPRAWKNAFRVGAANTIYSRLAAERRAQKKQREVEIAAAIKQSVNTDEKMSRESVALTVLEKDQQEVEREYAVFGKQHNFRATAAIGYVSSRTGYDAGKEAGERINLNRNRGALPEGQRRIGKE